MTSSEDMADRIKHTPIYELPVEVEGAYPPVATGREIRELLNQAWRELGRYDNPMPSDLAQVARAEIAFREAMTAAEDRMYPIRNDYVKVPAELIRAVEELPGLRQQLTELRAALGMSPDEDHAEVVKEIGLYRSMCEQYESQLARIREFTRSDTALIANMDKIREVLGR